MCKAAGHLSHCWIFLNFMEMPVGNSGDQFIWRGNHSLDVIF
jgi:hypothetical protein